MLSSAAQEAPGWLAMKPFHQLQHVSPGQVAIFDTNIIYASIKIEEDIKYWQQVLQLLQTAVHHPDAKSANHCLHI